MDPTFPLATTAAKFPPPRFDYLGLHDLLPPAELEVVRRVRGFMEREVAPIMAGVSGGTTTHYSIPPHQPLLPCDWVWAVLGACRVSPPPHPQIRCPKGSRDYHKGVWLSGHVGARQRHGGVRGTLHLNLL